MMSQTYEAEQRELEAEVIRLQKEIEVHIQYDGLGFIPMNELLTIEKGLSH